ncbi:MAG: hypothetical protein V4607_17640 [Pseudomonadota bacterium]
MDLRLNKLYIAFVAVAGTAALLFIGGGITAQVYGQWSQGLPITGGFSWPIVIGIDALCFLAALAMYWKIYADSKTTIDTSGISRPSLRGQQHIAWSDVTDIKIVGGVGFHLYAGRRKIVISPHAYQEPEAVIAALRRYTCTK